jgi:hypothetical protein
MTPPLHRYSVVLLLVCAIAPVLRAQETARPVVSEEQTVARMTLVKSADGSAVIRFGQSALETLNVGDRVGKSRATVIEAVPGRLLLEEVTTGPDGKPRRAQILIHDGETGGKKFLRHPDIDAPIALRPQIVDAPAPAVNGTTKTPSLR